MTIARIESSLLDLPLGKAPQLIEFGCGAGNLSLWFAQRGFRVTGLDISPFAVAWAQEKADQIQCDATFFVADLTGDLDPIPAPADIVLDGHCLHCIIGTDRKKFLANARRCLKPDGVSTSIRCAANRHRDTCRTSTPTRAA